MEKDLGPPHEIPPEQTGKNHTRWQGKRKTHRAEHSSLRGEKFGWFCFHLHLPSNLKPRQSYLTAKPRLQGLYVWELFIILPKPINKKRKLFFFSLSSSIVTSHFVLCSSGISWATFTMHRKRPRCGCKLLGCERPQIDSRHYEIWVTIPPVSKVQLGIGEKCSLDWKSLKQGSP